MCSQVEDQRTHRGVLDIVDFLRVVRDSSSGSAHFAQFQLSEFEERGFVAEAVIDADGKVTGFYRLGVGFSLGI